MDLTENSWKNFDSNTFNEMCCAGGASGISASAPEHVVGIMTLVGKPSEDVADASKPEGKAILPENEMENNNMLNENIGKATSWAEFNKLLEADQAAPAQVAPATPAAQPVAQPTTEAPAPVATVAPVAPTATEQTVTNTAGDTVTTPVEPAQPAAMTAQPAAPAAEATPAQTTAEAPINTQPANVAPQSQIANPAPAAQPVQESMNATSWAEYSKMEESIALPGGNLDAETTEYEKELDKHNKARKNDKVCGEVGDKDAGEIGAHGFDEEKGTPTATLADILKPRKSSKLILTGEK